MSGLRCHAKKATPIAWVVAAVAASPGGAAKLRIILGDVVAGVIAALVVTPLTQIVDVAVSQSASGQMGVGQGLIQEVKAWLTRPASKLKEPAFRLCWTVYLCTYIGANLVENACVQFLGISPVLPKFFGSTLCNMAACIYKDQAVAKIYGKKQKAGEEKPFTAAGYVLFLIRDLLANGGGFTFPSMDAPLLVPWLGARSATVAQLAVPAAINIISSPIHFLALDLYNNPDASSGERAKAIADSYAGATGSRILKGLAAYGIGGVSNAALRGRMGLFSLG